MLRWIIEKQNGVVWTDSSDLGLCERCNEPSVSIECWEILEWLSNWWLLKKGSEVSDAGQILGKGKKKGKLYLCLTN
jgi:hypothetical protein